MLKGLKKIKNAEAEKKESKPENGSVFEPQKKWKKSENDRKEKEKQKEIQRTDELDESVNVEAELGKLCIDLWKQFTKGEVLRATKTCEKLFIAQDTYFESVFRANKYRGPNDDLEEPGDRYEGLFIKEDSSRNRKGEDNSEDYAKAVSRSSGFNAEKYRQGIRQERLAKEDKHDYDDAAIDFFKKYKTAYNEDEIHDQEYIDKQILPMEDKDDDNKRKKGSSGSAAPSKKEQKIEEKKVHKQERYQFFAEKKADKAVSSCNYCFANQKVTQEQLISIAAINEVDEEVYEEIRNYQKCLVQAFDKIDYEILFVENAVHMKNLPHLLIECITLPRNTAADISVYFKQGIENMESEWNTHKKLYKITREQGGIRSQIPKGFPYFHADFGLRFGYAHIVEDERAFSKDFAHEIVSEILQVEKHKVLNPQRATKETFKNIRESLLPIWKDYDWAKSLS